MTKFCAKCGRGVNQNYCPQCGGTKFASRPQAITASCENCGDTTEKFWTCNACKRQICEKCVRSYKYITTLCTECFKIQAATAYAPAQPLVAASTAEPEEEEEHIELIEQPEPDKKGFFQKIKSAFGGIFR